jgi:hypothetical protein
MKIHTPNYHSLNVKSIRQLHVMGNCMETSSELPFYTAQYTLDRCPSDVYSCMQRQSGLNENPPFRVFVLYVGG